MSTTMAVFHPQRDEQGNRVALLAPSVAHGLDRLTDADQAATFVPGQIVNGDINGVRFGPWQDVPVTASGWNGCINKTLAEPPFILPKGLRAAAGTVVLETDGRVWLVAPSNGFGGYQATFPKGRAEPSLSLQATAIKETYEESGLATTLHLYIGDFARTQTYTRFYLARRIGGTPADMGWESQAVHLVPQRQACQWLNRSTDHAVLAAAINKIENLQPI